MTKNNITYKEEYKNAIKELLENDEEYLYTYMRFLIESYNFLYYRGLVRDTIDKLVEREAIRTKYFSWTNIKSFNLTDEEKELINKTNEFLTEFQENHKELSKEELEDYIEKFIEKWEALKELLVVLSERKKILK